MATNDAVERIGLGVDLIGGPETLAGLRAIREEYEAIIALGGRGGSAGGSAGASINPTSELQAKQKAENDIIRQGARDKLTLERQITDEELTIRAKAANQKQDLNKRINERAEQLRREEKEKQISFARDEAARHQAELEAKKRRIEQFSRDQAIIEKDFGPERRAFKRHRNDPARDDRTNEQRQELAEEIRGSRIGLRERRAFLQQQRQDEQQLIDEDSRQRRRQAQQKLVDLYASDPTLINRDLGAQRRLLRRYRDDPARDDRTNIFRREVAAEILAQRKQIREQDALEDERKAVQQKAINNRQSYFEADRRIQGNIASDEKRVADRVRRTAELRQQFEGALEPQLQKILTRNNRQVVLAQKQLRTADPTLIPEFTQHINDLIGISEKVEGIRNKIRTAAATQVPKIQSEIPELFREQQGIIGRLTQSQTNQLALEGPAGPIRPRQLRGGPDGPGGPPKFNPQQALANERGFFTTGDVIGRITRNILLYEVISRATYGLANYVQTSIKAAKTTVEYANALRFATEQSGGNLAANQRLADSLLSIGLSRQQGRAAVVEAARFTERRPQDTAALVDVTTNIAAARGLGIDKTDELIEQLRRRESKFYKRVFGTTVESIYEQEAQSQVSKRTTNPINNPDLYVGIKKDEIESNTEAVKKYVAAMTDEQKEQSVLNYILAQSSRFQGEAAERADTLAGKLDKLAAAWLNNQENLGLFITDLKSVRSVLDFVTNQVGIFNKLAPPQIGRSGPKGTITSYDVEKFGIDSSTGTRARLLNTVDSLVGPTLLGAGGILGAGLLGKRPASLAVKNETFERVVQASIKKYDGDFAAAATEAANQAKSAKPGLIRTVAAGVTRVNDSIIRGVNYTTGLGINEVPNVYYPKGLAGGPPKQISDEVLARRDRQTSAIRGGAGLVGGATGGFLGATIGSVIAEKITSNQIVATGITILGGAVGTVAGTAAGNVISGALTGAGGAGAAGIAAAAAPVAIPLGVGALITYLATRATERAFTPFATGGQFKDIGEGPQYLAREEAASIAYAQQQRELRAANDRAFRDKLIDPLTSVEKSRSLGLNDLNQRAASFGVNLYRGRTSPSGGVDNIFDPSDLQRTVSNTIDKTREEIGNLNTQLAGTTDTEAQKTINASLSQRGVILANLLDQQKTINLEVDRENNLRRYGTTDEKSIENIKEYEAEAAQRELDRKQKEQEELQQRRSQYVSELGNALSKLRDTQQGSFRIPGDVATSLIGDQNPYVKALADQVTVAERMKQQWGFLGDAATKYFTILEQKANDRILLQLDYQTFQQASELRRKSQQEILERNRPGEVSRKEQDYLNIQSAIVDKAVEIPKLWAQAAAVLGRTINPIRELQGKIKSLQVATGQGAVFESLLGNTITYGGGGLKENGERIQGVSLDLGSVVGGRRIRGFSAGQQSATIIGPDGKPVETRDEVTGLPTGIATQFTLNAGQRDDYADYFAKRAEQLQQSPEVRKRIQQSYAEQALSIFSEYQPDQIRQSGLAGTFLGALGLKGQGLNEKIEDARKKAEYGAIEDAQLQAQLRRDDDFRRKKLAEGQNPAEVGRLSDALLLSRTEGVNPRDLTFDQFRDRQDALRREAEDKENDRQEAKAAVAEGLKQQQAILDDVSRIRQALVGGDLKMLVQVQNDTQAKVDQSYLEEYNTGKRSIPLDQSETKSNPYTGLNERYGRGGRKK
jgi:hypothetical protein